MSMTCLRNRKALWRQLLICIWKAQLIEWDALNLRLQLKKAEGQDQLSRKLCHASSRGNFHEHIPYSPHSSAPKFEKHRIGVTL